MVTAETLRKILLEEYGISNDKELEDAIRKMPKINIGIFVSPVIRDYEKEERKGA